MIVYEGNITEEPDLRSWVLRTLRDNGPLTTLQIIDTLTFYEAKYVAKVVHALHRDEAIGADPRHEDVTWAIIAEGRSILRPAYAKYHYQVVIEGLEHMVESEEVGHE